MRLGPSPLSRKAGTGASKVAPSALEASRGSVATGAPLTARVTAEPGAARSGLCMKKIWTKLPEPASGAMGAGIETATEPKGPNTGWAARPRAPSETSSAESAAGGGTEAACPTGAGPPSTQAPASAPPAIVTESARSARRGERASKLKAISPLDLEVAVHSDRYIKRYSSQPANGGEVGAQVSTNVGRVALARIRSPSGDFIDSSPLAGIRNGTPSLPSPQGGGNHWQRHEIGRIHSGRMSCCFPATPPPHFAEGGWGGNLFPPHRSQGGGSSFFLGGLLRLFLGGGLGRRLGLGLPAAVEADRHAAGDSQGRQRGQLPGHTHAQQAIERYAAGPGHHKRGHDGQVRHGELGAALRGPDRLPPVN